MRLLGFNMLIVLFVLEATSYAQTDTLDNRNFNSSHKTFREKSSSILIGAHLQQTEDQSGNQYQRKYLEVGLHKSLITGYAVFTHGLSVEVSPEKRTIVGFKYGGWTNIYFVSFGLNGIYYTNFKQGDFIIRPELGLGVDRFRFAIGFNISTISNKRFKEIKKEGTQFILNILIKRKLIKND